MKVVTAAIAALAFVSSQAQASAPVYCSGPIRSTESGMEGKEIGSVGIHIWKHRDSIKAQHQVKLNDSTRTIRISRNDLQKAAYENHVHYTGEGVSIVVRAQSSTDSPVVNLELSHEQSYWQGTLSCPKGTLVLFP